MPNTIVDLRLPIVDFLSFSPFNHYRAILKSEIGNLKSKIQLSLAP